MASRIVTTEFMYEVFGDLYHEETYPKLLDDEVAVHEAVQCLLKSFLTRRTPVEMFNEKTVILSFGRLVHRGLQDYLVKRGYAVEVERKEDCGTFTLVSHTDALHVDHILELKTITATPSQILDHHLMQANAYLYPNNVMFGYVVYIQKPSGKIFTFPFERDDTLHAVVKLRGRRLSECFKRNMTPEPEMSWLCRYCEYARVCPAKPLQRRRR